MPVMMEKLYDALLAAHVPEAEARAAALEAAEQPRLAEIETRLSAVETRVTAVETRLGAVEARLTVVEGKVSALMWMLALNLGLTAGILGKLLTLH